LILRNLSTRSPIVCKSAKRLWAPSCCRFSSMIETSAHQGTLQERQIQAFVRGADLEMMEVRGYGLT
jgi:hypothetical protein